MTRIQNVLSLPPPGIKYINEYNKSVAVEKLKLRVSASVHSSRNVDVRTEYLLQSPYVRLFRSLANGRGEGYTTEINCGVGACPSSAINSLITTLSRREISEI